MAEQQQQQSNAGANADVAAPPLPTARWPDAAPIPGEDGFFSISCGNSHLHWAFHFGEKDYFNPATFWRTPHLSKQDTENEKHISILSRNLPDDAHDHVFGKTTADATYEDAVKQSNNRTNPLLSVYVVSTNKKQADLLAKIWKTVPCRFVVMEGDDFFKEENGRYDTMGIDRLATLTGAVQMHGHPALVFDGGTATTYSATDSDGKILGGGIGPGIQSKFRSLTKDTDALPEITMSEVIARVNEATERGNPLPTFARDTKEAMMVDAFQEVAYKGRNVISQWLQKAYKNNTDDDEEEGGTKFNNERKVMCTGGDGDILMQLLQPHYGGVIEHNNTEGRQKYTVQSSKHLIHYGIASVLYTRVALRNKKEELDRNPDMEHIGKRVAKQFTVENDDGDNIFRGKVVKIVESEHDGGDNQFRIQYDEGDSEDVSKKELFDMFKLYDSIGEKKDKKSKKKKKDQAERDLSEREDYNQSQLKPDEVRSNNKAADGKKAKKSAKRSRASEDDASNTKKPGKKAKTAKAKTDAKKPAKADIADLVKKSDPRTFVDKRIAKDFDGETYFGNIIKYDDSENPAFWHVEYDDGDEEDYSKKDLIKALKHYQLKGKNDPKAK